MTSIVVSQPTFTVNDPANPTVTVSDVAITIEHTGGSPFAVQGVRYLSQYTGTDRTGATECATAVQAALTAWGGTYDIVVDGTFKVSTPITIPNNTTLSAARPGIDGFTGTWQLASAGAYFLGNATTDGTATGIRLYGLRITGAGDGTPWGPNEISGTPVIGLKFYEAVECEVVGCYFYRITGQSINAAGVRNIKVTDCTFREGGRDGVAFYWRPLIGLDNALVANNTFRLMGDDCIAIWSGSTTSENGTAATVTTTAGSTTVTGSGTSWVAGDVGKIIAITAAAPGASHYEGVIAAVTDSTHVTVSPMVATAAADTPAFYGFDRPSNITISGNNIEQDTSAHSYGGNRGINLGGIGAASVTGNTIKGTHDQGLRVGVGPQSDLLFSRDVACTGNVVEDAGRYQGASPATGRRHGIELDGTIACSVVGGSVRRSYSSGIHVRNSIAPRVEGVVVEANGTTSDDHAVQFWGTGSGAHLVVAPAINNCTIRHNYGGGIWFYNTRDGSLAVGNTIDSNGQGGEHDTDQAGIVCQGSVGWTLVGNIITDTGHSSTKTQWGGVRVTNSGGSPYLMLLGNYIYGNGGGNLVLSNTSTEVLKRGNLITAETDPDSYDQDFEGTTRASGAGSPEGVVTANIGSLWQRTDGSTGTSLYVKESGTGNTGWAVVGGTMTAAAILTALLTVDGAGSGLDADLLDGQSGAYYLDRTNHTGTQAGSTVDAATTDARGTVELATNSETAIGTDTARATTPAGVKAALDVHTGDSSAAHAGSAISIDASGFNGNLTTSDDTVQEVAQKLDDLSVSGGSFDLAAQIAFGG